MLEDYKLRDGIVDLIFNEQLIKSLCNTFVEERKSSESRRLEISWWLCYGHGGKFGGEVKPILQFQGCAVLRATSLDMRWKIAEQRWGHKNKETPLRTWRTSGRNTYIKSCVYTLTQRATTPYIFCRMDSSERRVELITTVYWCEG